MAAPRNVLVVDDDPVHRRVVSEQLRSLGHAPVGVSSGFQALERLAQGRFEVILLDLEMPTLDGHATARLIREREGAGPRSVILAVTARDPGDARARLRSAGVDDVLAKPVSAERLAAALQRWLEDGSTGAAADESAPSAGLAILDPRSTAPLRRLGILAAVLEIFGQSLENHLGALRAAVAALDLSQVVRSAHTLRGAAAQIGARQLAAACTELEEVARAGLQARDPERLRASLHALEDHVLPLQEALRVEAEGRVDA